VRLKLITNGSDKSFILNTGIELSGLASDWQPNLNQAIAKALFTQLKNPMSLIPRIFSDLSVQLTTMTF